MSKVTKVDVVVIGGGAAGLFCAAEAGKRGRKTCVLERNAQVGRKIVISGGGRCNFTNLSVTAENFVSQNPHFAKSALSQYTADDFVELVKKHRVPFYEKTLGQLFCKGRSKEIVDLLLNECARADVAVETDCGVRSVLKREKGFEIETNRGVFKCESLVVATGGLSFPKIGATDFGHQLAKQFGLEVVPIRPSLVPLRFKGQSFKELAGVSVEAVGETGAEVFRENILFTHFGLSGPLTLQLSNYWAEKNAVEFDLIPDLDIALEIRNARNGKKTLRSIIAGKLPGRFISKVFRPKTLDKNLTEFNSSEIEAILEQTKYWRVFFNDTEGWDKAEVTIGGVDTNELNSSTMESRKVQNLFFIGEVVDVTGWLGGYNFQWAWSSGYVCGQTV